MTLEEEMLEQLRGERERSEIVVHDDDDRYVSLILTRYPFVGSKIDWTSVPGAVEMTFSAADRSDISTPQISSSRKSPWWSGSTSSSGSSWSAMAR